MITLIMKTGKTVMTKADLIEEVNSGVHREYVFFWRRNDEAGYCSQWYSSPFTIDGVVYPTAEHYMMAGKARLFHDQATLQRIMESSTPREAKSLGRKVAGLDPEVWQEHGIDVVVTANLAKFRQNRELLKRLLSTGTAVLVEASPYDRKWGIGLLEIDEGARKPDEWQGDNLLGFCLMRVREMLAKDQGHCDS